MGLRIFFLALAASLTFPGLRQAFRSDEIWTLHTVALPLGQMMDVLRSDFHPPLYYLLLKPWVAVAGSSEVGARAFSILLHFGAAAAVFFMARSRVGAGRAAVCAAVFLASPLGIVAAQLIRMYSLLELTAALSILFWLRFAGEERMKWRWWAGFVAANIAGTFTHVWFFFLLAGIAVTHLAFWRVRRLGWMTLAAAASLLPWAILWLPVMLRQANLAAADLAWLKPPHWSAPIEVALMQAGAAGLIAGVALLLKRRERGVEPLPWILWPAVIVVPFTISFVQPLFWARFTVVALPVLALALGTWISSRIQASAALASVVLASALFTAGVQAARTDRCDSRWTARWIAGNTGPGDLVLFTNLSRLPVEHYLGRTVQAERRSFPASIDVHPAYEGRTSPAAFDSELQMLMGELSARPRRRIVLLHGFDPSTHQKLTGAFDARYRREPDLCLKCLAIPNYYREITVWQTQ